MRRSLTLKIEVIPFTSKSLEEGSLYCDRRQLAESVV